MDSCAEFVDTVKVGKAKAARRGRKTGQFKSLVHVAEACLAMLVLLSWCSGGGLSVALDHSLRLFHLLGRPLPVFLLSNCIIVVIVILSRIEDRKQKTGAAADSSGGIYDEYLSYAGTTQVTGARPLELEESTEETSQKNLQIVPYVAEAKPAAPTKPTEPEVSRAISTTPNVVTTAVKDGGRNYGRTRSALAVRSCRHEHGRALRRSTTENGRDMAPARPPRRSVDDLSNEEFNQMVENHIARTRRFLQRELMADPTANVPTGSHHNVSDMAVAVRN